MRILFTCIPQTGHVTPLMPLALALVDQGDDVVVATGPDARPIVESSGVTFTSIGPPFGEWFAALRGRTRGNPGDGLAPERVETYFVPRLFGEIGTAVMLDDLMETSRTFSPDLVVFDPLCFAGPLLAARLGAPGIQHSIGPVLDAHVLDLATDAVSPIWREFGLDVPPAAGLYQGTTITICPPSLDPAAQNLRDALALRPVPLPVEPAPDFPVRGGTDEAPLIYVTLGTFSNNLDLFGLILDALAGEPVSVIATIGADKDPADLEPIPANARVERYIPQHELLPHCSAVVHHAGAGTSFAALAHGLPSVALPQSADNFKLARRLSQAGVSIELAPHEVNSEAVSSALAEILRDQRWRRAAQDSANEIADMPGPIDVARTLRSKGGRVSM